MEKMAVKLKDENGVWIDDHKANVHKFISAYT